MAYILAVDDTPDLLDALTVIMTKRGHEVKAVYTKAEVLQELEMRQPDLILLDVFLGFTDGRELCKEIREKYGYGIKIILISAGDRLLDNYQEFGADAVLAKPFDLTHLISLVKSVVGE